MSTSPRRSSTTPLATERWSPEQAADYAARRDFRLLQLLSTDRRAFAAARRLGVPGFGLPVKRRDRQKPTDGASQQASTLKQRAAQVQTVATIASLDAGNDAHAPMNSRERRNLRRRLKKYEHLDSGDTRPTQDTGVDSVMAEMHVYMRM